ncbi:MAG: hypothetical protein ACYDAN_01130 [Candidatus Limnocylindrales bacterium]
MLRRTVPAIALVLAVAACGAAPSRSPAIGVAGTSSLANSSASPAPSASTGSSAAPDPAWHDASITQPEVVNGFASQPPGYYCDPCHNLAEDDLFGVAAVSGGFIAVGDVTPPASAIALWSADGATWTPLPGFTGDDGSAAVGVAGAGGRLVLVGHDPTGATAWAGDLRSGWRRSPSQASLAVAHAAGGMTSIVPFDGGFVAAGYRDDPAALHASGAVWRSKDGLAWTLDADGGAFSGGRIMALAVTSDALVAVGTSGDQVSGPAAAWRWTATTGWRRASVPPGGGAMRAVVATASGLVAVGVNAQDAGAAAWTSTDGWTWQAVADQPAFHFYQLPVRLQALALVNGTLVAGGWRSDPGKGSSVVVMSTDGETWSALPWQASFSGGQIDGLATANRTLVAAGRAGYPDTDTAAVWVRSWP